MKPRHWFVFILLGAIWSSSFLWIKIAVQEIDPITLVAFRTLFGLIFGLAVMFVQRVPWPRRRKSWLPLVLLGITNVAVPFFLISWGEQSIDSGVAAVLDATVPLFTIVIAHLALHDDKITVPRLLGLLVGFVGVVILMSKDIGASSLFPLGGVILGVTFLHEPLTWQLVAGAILIIVSLAVANRQSAKHPALSTGPRTKSQERTA